MHKELTMKKILFVLGFALSSSAFAQYAGPSTILTYTKVADVLSKAVDDSPVVLEGFLVKKVASEKYLFKDSTGEIRVDIDSKYFPNTLVDEKTKVKIRGEFEKDFLVSPEIDVEYPIELLK